MIVDYWQGARINVGAAPKAAPTSGVKRTPADGATVTDRGEVVARIATLNVIDLQGDVIVAGAVGSGQDVVIGQYNHGSYGPSMLPAGAGRVTEEGNSLLLRGRLFLDTIAGRETFFTLKGMVNSPWSFGYQIAESDRGNFGGEYVRFLRKLVLSEASPVIQAAGIGTGTVHLASLDSFQIELQGEARQNERELLALRGFTPGRERVGYHPTSGAAVYATAGGLK